MISNSTENMVMPVAPMTGSGSNCFGGGDGWWILLLLLFAGGFGNGFGGFGGDGVMPYMWNAQTQNDVNRGFDNAGLAGQLSGIQAAITGGFANADVSRANAEVNNLQTEYANQIASMNQRFADTQMISNGFNNISAQMAQCCCDNRLATVQTNNTIISEAGKNREVIAATTQKILDQMCNDKIDAKNEKIADLERQLSMAQLSASQQAQNAFIAQGFANEVNDLYNRLANCPVPSTPVYGRTPIFTPTSTPTTTPAA